MKELLLTGGRVVSPKNSLNKLADVLLAGGRIKKIGKIKETKNQEVIKAKGLIIVPGLIDMHVHFRTPGQETKEDIVSGSRAAARGGFTTVVSMPNTKPVIDSGKIAKEVKARAAKESLVNLYFYASLTKDQRGKVLVNYQEMEENGVVGFSDDGEWLADPLLARQAIVDLKERKMLYVSHPEDKRLGGNGVINDGAMATRLGLLGKPALAEELAILQDTMIASSVGAPLHLTHVSTRGAVAIIREMKKVNSRISCDVTPHHFSLTEDKVFNFDTAAKVNPPLRTKQDVQEILAGIKDGTIDVIASDHAPHSLADKAGSFTESAFGISGIETSLAVALTKLYRKQIIPLTRIIELMSVAPAKLLHFKNKGQIKNGADADITIIDLHAKEKISPDLFLSKGKATPFAGMTVQGWPLFTIVGGKVVMANRKIKL